jgi:hypothetical protein
VVANFPPKELVRYLSQSFVEKLRSDDYEGVDLAQEIEGVIFGHLDPTDTLNASSLKDLRDLRTRETTKDRCSESMHAQGVSQSAKGSFTNQKW